MHTDTPRQIPLADIDATALTRDRTHLDPAALDELRISIAATGLRMPIEVFALEDSPHPFGLISGFRRLTAFRALHDLTRAERYATIPAFIRTPASLAEALAAMVAENAIRVDLSPWEQGRVITTAFEQGLFANIEAATDALHAGATKAKRSRLRTLARLVEALDGDLTDPETLSVRQALRLAAAVRAGFAPLIRTALAESRDTTPALQWRILLPILAEAERPPEAQDEAHTEATSPDPRYPTRPRRILTPRHNLTIRRELTRTGWALHFTGRDATSSLIDTVFDEIERMFGPP